MFDAFPFDEWSEDIAEFWTFGGANSTGTYIMTGIGVAAMLLAFIGFVLLENKKLERQAATLKASGALERPAVVVTTVITSD
jgi:ABC-type enterobactin transport system permease subunit